MSDTHDPIRPAHYRDPDTGRDRIAVWSATLGPDEFLAAIGATVDRYLSRAGLKPGVPAEQDRAKAAEVARRYFEEWGEGADELLGEFLGDLGHSHEAIDELLLAAAQPRTATPTAEVTPQQAEQTAPQANPLAGVTPWEPYGSDDTAGDDSSAAGEGDSSALPPDGYDWHDGAGDTEVLTDEHEEAAAWITRSTLPGGADQWSWWLASDSAMGVEKDVRHESTWKAARIGVRRAIEKRSSDSSAQRSAEGGEA